MSDKKHFSKEIMPRCAYCLKGQAISGGEEIFCIKKGITAPNDSCKSFKYDPLKRVPMRAPSRSGFTKEDFEL